MQPPPSQIHALWQLLQQRAKQKQSGAAGYRPPVRCLLRLLSLLRLLGKFEGDQRRSCWYLFKLREQRRKQDRGVRTPATWHQNVLLAVDGVADDAAAHSGACIEAPQ